MNKSISFTVSLSKKEVQDIIFDHIAEKYDEKDLDFKRIRTFDEVNYHFNDNSETDFVEVNMDAFMVPLRRTDDESKPSRKFKKL